MQDIYTCALIVSDFKSLSVQIELLSLTESSCFVGSALVECKHFKQHTHNIFRSKNVLSCTATKYTNVGERKYIDLIHLILFALLLVSHFKFHFISFWFFCSLSLLAVVSVECLDEVVILFLSTQYQV